MIVPAIIPESKTHASLLLEKLRDVSVSDIQIDLVDGVYAGVPSWPWNTKEVFTSVLSLVSELSKTYAVEVDLMVERPEQYAQHLIDAGASRLVVHVGSTENLTSLLQLNSGTRIGLGLTNEKPLSYIFEHAAQIDFVQCMGIAEIGVQGNGFDDRVLPRIREIKTAHPGLEIAVDGSVNMFTLPLLKEAGATRFVAGSAIFKDPDPVKAYALLTKLALV